MLDYMSDFPAPPPQVRKQNLINDFNNSQSNSIVKYNKKKFNKYEDYNKYIEDVTNKISGVVLNHPYYIDPGSASGYAIFTRKNYLKSLKINFNKKYDEICLKNAKDKLNLALVIYSNKSSKKDCKLSIDILEKIGGFLNFE